MHLSNNTSVQSRLIGLLLFIGLLVGGKVNAEFIHPGMWANETELEIIRGRVQAGTQPQKASYDKIKNSSFANLSWTPTTITYVEVGPYNDPKINYDALVDNSRAAWAHAIVYMIEQDDRHAQKVLDILDAHAKNFQEIKGHNTELLAGWVGKNWYKAIDLVKPYYNGWNTDIENRFHEMYNRVYIPHASRINLTGNNWDFYQMESWMAAAIIQENQAWFDDCIEKYSILLPHYIAPNGECEETCRDLGHAWMGIAAAVRICEMAWKQGVDIYSINDNRLLKGLEFHAKYTIQGGGTCSECGTMGGSFSRDNCSITMKNMSNFNERQMGWEAAYNHYHNRMGFSAPLTYNMVLDTRPNDISRWGDGPGTLFHADMGDVSELIVHIIKPENNSFFSPGDDVEIDVSAFYGQGAVSSVKIYSNNELLTTLTSEPYTYTINDVTEGLYTIRTEVTDNEENIKKDTVTFSVSSLPQYIKLEAENHDAMSGITMLDGAIGGTDNNDFIRFNSVDLLNGYSKISARVGCPVWSSGQKVEVRLDAENGELVGELTIPGTGDWNSYTEIDADITSVAGVHDIFFVFRGSNGIGNFDWFRFENPLPAGEGSTARNPMHAWSPSGCAQFKSLPEGGFEIELSDNRPAVLSMKVFNVAGQQVLNYSRTLSGGTHFTKAWNKTLFGSGFLVARMTLKYSGGEVRKETLSTIIN